MRQSLLGAYNELKESASTSDFPLLLGNVQHKALLNGFRAVASAWREYVKIGDLSDFKAHDRIILGESPDLLEIPEGMGYTDSSFKERRYQIQAKTYGREWSVTRQAVINDDLGGLTDVGGRFGRATARTLVKQIVAVLESNGSAYDGNPLFTAGHGNMSSTALTADANGIAALDAGFTAIRNSTEPDSGEKMGIGTSFKLLVPPALEMKARWLKAATGVFNGAASGLTLNPLNLPQFNFDVVVEPFLTFAGRWYLLVAPSELHWLEVGFLNGKEDPDVLVKRAEAMRVAGGGEDPYGYEFDDIRYKVRHDWALSAAYYQGIYKGGS